MMADYDDDDQDILHIDDITKLYGQNLVSKNWNFQKKPIVSIVDSRRFAILSQCNRPYLFQAETQKPENILESKTNRDEWQLELEKVLPRLKVTVKTGTRRQFYVTKLICIYSNVYTLFTAYHLDLRDWRAHLEQMKQLRANIATDMNSTKTHLNKIHNDISNTFDKITTRETYLNRQLEPSLTEYRSLQVNLQFNTHVHTLCNTLYFIKSNNGSESQKNTPQPKT